ncbi:TIGR04348 family glycosyltransferase [Caenimonas sedimenti]|uniref:TIGR04348 family glycosyltransferase n=1 Tax=Caenimonas sedimenti TaxID=2596921 RepID=A0A562ZIL0_9BURK|nr:selenoneine biosynthesis selenosugar synthase SenB [Caenimonas sedimenti]TWO68034.1 TIGR04348 family glycosyltransferase [Caenimonas sedimenti]
MRYPSIVIVSPALADANNGNWQTARRWRQLLGATHPVRITQQWPDARAESDEIMLALHARRSAEAVQAWANAHGPRGLAVILTGTDLYRDITIDQAAQRSLDVAQLLVVLQELGLDALPAQARAKARVIYQSAALRQTLPKTTRSLRAVMVGHLRQVKSPQTLFDAARLLGPCSGIQICHIGEASEAALGELARRTARECLHYHWLGALPHAATRQAIQRAHVLVHTSAMEGGAHVIMEAIRSGTPVLASRVGGNVGMLGKEYEGYFEHGDAAGLATLLECCRAGQRAATQDQPATLLARLRAQCALRTGLFDPGAERQALMHLVDDLQAGPQTQRRTRAL